MSRRVRWLIVIALVLVVAGAIAAVLTVQPKLSDARDRVDARWSTLRSPLLARYSALDGVSKSLKDAGEGNRSVTKDLDAALARWSKLALRGAEHTDPGVEASTANELEALARRVRANIVASDRLKTNTALGTALGTFDQSVVSPPDVKAYNAAVRHYEDEREGAIHHLVATILGDKERAQLFVGGT
jgi:hypothetical protein